MAFLPEDEEAGDAVAQTTTTTTLTTCERGFNSEAHNREQQQHQDVLSIEAKELEEDEDEATKPGCFQQLRHKLVTFFWKYDFPIYILLAIGLAKAYPPLGAALLRPEISATWAAVMFMFFVSGVGLKTDDFVHSVKQVRFNGYVQFYNFFVCSSVTYGVSRILILSGALEQALGDGMVIACCLPMALNTATVLTVAIGGDEASSVFNTTLGNIIGIFLSPVLIMMYLGTSGSISIATVFWKLAIRVIVPLILGQLLQKFSQTVREFFAKHKPYFKKANELALVFIIYTVFCRTFMDSDQPAIVHILLMILFQLLLLCLFMAGAWYSLAYFFTDELELRIFGLFGACHKTIALGIPLIISIYHDDPNEGLYSLPILIWHPMQLIVGSLFVPRLVQWLHEGRTSRLAAEKPNCESQLGSSSASSSSSSTCEPDLEAGGLNNDKYSNEEEGVVMVTVLREDENDVESEATTIISGQMPDHEDGEEEHDHHHKQHENGDHNNNRREGKET